MIYQFLALAAGLGLLYVGCKEAWSPLGPIVVGGLLVAGVVIARMR